MFASRLIITLSLLLPFQAWSAYDVEEIKDSISKNHLFGVTNWVKKDTTNTWIATTSLKRVVISIGENKAKYIAPYINSRQKKSAKILCADFAAITTQSSDKASKDAIKEAIRGATTRHKMKYLTLNNIKFSVSPKLIGAIVSLHCSTKMN